MSRAVIFFLLTTLFTSANAFAEPTAIFLVRHAEKATGGDLKDPELSEAGRARAATLAELLHDVPLTAIYASEFQRTQHTAQPLADATQAKIETVPAKETPALVAKIKTASGNVLIVGHSNTLPEIIAALGVTTPLTIGESDYDNLFLVLPGAPAQLLRLHFK